MIRPFSRERIVFSKYGAKTIGYPHAKEWRQIPALSHTIDMILKVWATGENKWNFTEIKNFGASKDTTKKVQRQPTEKEKIFANHISDKRLVSRITNNSYNSATTTEKHQITQFKHG